MAEIGEVGIMDVPPSPIDPIPRIIGEGGIPHASRSDHSLFARGRTPPGVLIDPPLGGR